MNLIQQQKGRPFHPPFSVSPGLLSSPSQALLHPHPIHPAAHVVARWPARCPTRTPAVPVHLPAHPGTCPHCLLPALCGRTEAKRGSLQLWSHGNGSLPTTHVCPAFFHALKRGEWNLLGPGNAPLLRHSLHYSLASSVGNSLPIGVPWQTHRVFMSPCGRKWSHHRVRREDKCSVVSMYRGKLTAGRGFAEEVAFGRMRMRFLALSAKRTWKLRQPKAMSMPRAQALVSESHSTMKGKSILWRNG
ncbi:uncharacterized protein [Symphalangus syndactylus]|uniref:uncharacterized protein n=1 Tax=Symphalangus syndactylus TaxID=9590 RepID=UPI003004D918